MALQRSDFRLYEQDEDAQKDINVFRKDWDFYDILAYAAKHKTGLKLSLLSDEATGDVHIVSDNFAEWARYMTNDEKMTGHEVALYKRQLTQEFEVLLLENDRQAGAIQDILPYAMMKSMETKS